MKKMLLSLSVALLLLTGCLNNVKGNLLPEEQETNNDVEQEPDSENQRIELYIGVIKSVFYEKNGGGDFIAVKTETLEGLNSKQKH